MRVVLHLIALLGLSAAYDAVVFSDEQELSPAHPSLEVILAGASAEHPVVILGEPDFTLGLFSRQASLYTADGSPSPLTKLVKESKHSTQRHLDVTYHISDSQLITKSTDYAAGASVYFVSTEDWASLEQVGVEVLKQLPAGYTAVLSTSDAFSQQATRVKRDTFIDDDEEAEPENARFERQAAAATTLELPLILPPFINSQVTPVPSPTSCLLYMEAVTIVASHIQGDLPSTFASAAATIVNGTFDWDPSYVSCNVSEPSPGSYSFRVSVKSAGRFDAVNVNGAQFSVAQGAVFDFTLTFVEDLQHYWSLSQVVLNQPIKITSSGKKGFVESDVTTTNATARGVGYMGINSVVGYSINCGDTPAAWFATDNEAIAIGVAFHNFQVQLRNVNATAGHYFDLQVVDCTGTFSTGSWMGIITSLVLLAVLIFGFLMLNSVQTGDRFDDPKQKQIVINVRE